MIIAICLLAFLAAAWPYLLGTWIAVQLGAGQPSSARTSTGWVLEIVYLVGLPFIAWLLQTTRPGTLPCGCSTPPP